MARTKTNNVFTAQYKPDCKDLIPTELDDEILTKFFDLGYDEKDMMVDEVYDFILALNVPELLISKYIETLKIEPLDDLKQNLCVTGLEDDGMVDFDKLVFFVCRFLILRNNYDYIVDFWKVFIDFIERHESKKTKGDVFDRVITFPDLKELIRTLKLQDTISDGVIIDMVANGSDNAKPYLNIFDFAMLLGKTGDF